MSAHSPKTRRPSTSPEVDLGIDLVRLAPEVVLDLFAPGVPDVVGQAERVERHPAADEPGRAARGHVRTAAAERRRVRPVGALEGVGQGPFAMQGDLVEAAPGSALGRGQPGILPAAGEQARLRQAVERLVEGAVGGQPSGAVRLAQLLGQLEAVDLGHAAPTELDGDLQDGDLQGDQAAGSSSHGRYAALPLVTG